MVLFHEQIGKVLLAVERRLYLGASFKVDSLELGALASTYVKPRANPSSIAMKTLEPRKDTGKVYEAQHEEVYKSNRRLFVVHGIVPSKEAGQLYDVILYVVAHKSSLIHLEKVEYFLGESWRNYVFTSRDRATRFPIYNICMEHVSLHCHAVLQRRDVASGPPLCGLRDGSGRTG
jgi:hypothetical protein